MRKCLEISVPDCNKLQKQLIVYASTIPVACVLNSNNFSPQMPGHCSFQTYNFVAALHSLDELTISEKQNPFDELYSFWNNYKDWLFGHLSYDLKNSIENLSSVHPDYIGFSGMYFFRPRFVIEVKSEKAIIWYTEVDSVESISEALKQIEKIEIVEKNNETINIQPRIGKQEYISAVEKIKHQIKSGNIYEMNFCQEFFAEEANLDPAQLYLTLCYLSPAPFSCFYKTGNKFLISASPERFLNKTGNYIVSQPMKGTSRKEKNETENIVLREKLSNSKKEIAENIMIVDLVRNDLARTALPESVLVEELCGVYEFPQVFQMISTVSSKVSDETKFTDIIRCAFPMGSMTGAPKIRAMEIIETYEKTKRGLYSGSVGYICPLGNFDLNVIIRSIQYNFETKYLSFLTGGAITIKSNPHDEYEECIVKAKGILMTLNGKLIINF